MACFFIDADGLTTVDCCPLRNHTSNHLAPGGKPWQVRLSLSRRDVAKRWVQRLKLWFQRRQLPRNFWRPLDVSAIKQLLWWCFHETTSLFCAWSHRLVECTKQLIRKHQSSFTTQHICCQRNRFLVFKCLMYLYLFHWCQGKWCSSEVYMLKLKCSENQIIESCESLLLDDLSIGKS